MPTPERVEVTQEAPSRSRTLSILLGRRQTRREIRSAALRADAWLLAEALADLSTLGLPQTAVDRGRFAVVSRRNRAALEMFASEEDARRALAAVTARRSTLEGRFVVVDARLAGPPDAAGEPDELLGTPRPHVA